MLTLGSLLRVRLLHYLVICAGVIVLSGCQGEEASPSGEIGVIDTSDLGRVVLISPESGAVRRLRVPGRASSVDFSADGDKIAVDAFKGILVVSRRGGRTRRLPIRASSDEYALGDVTWSPDATQLVFSDVVSIGIYSLKEQKSQRLISHGGFYYELDWSPTGRLIAFVRNPDVRSGDGVIEVVKTDGTGRRVLVTGRRPDISPDGSHIAFARGPDVFTIAAQGGQPTRLIENADHPEWSPDGRYIAFTRNVACDGVGCVGRVFFVAAEGGSARALGPEIFDIGPLTWTRKDLDQVLQSSKSAG